MYKAVINDNYLCHYNKNHSSKNGQFTSGDGDGDGVSDDHAHRGEKKKGLSKKAKVGLAVAGSIVGTAVTAGAIAGIVTKIGENRQLNNIKSSTINSGNKYTQRQRQRIVKRANALANEYKKQGLISYNGRLVSKQDPNKIYTPRKNDRIVKRARALSKEYKRQGLVSYKGRLVSERNLLESRFK